MSAITDPKTVMELLKQGNKLSVERICFDNGYVLTLLVADDNGHGRTVSINPNGFSTAQVGEPIICTKVSVVSYTSSKFVPIQYIYANPQRNVIVAHLADGRDVPYNINLFDIESGCVTGVLSYD